MTNRTIARDKEAKGTGLDLALSIVFTAVGLGTLALSHGGIAGMEPDLLGSITVGILGVVFARAARLTYRQVAGMSIAILLMQVAACLAIGVKPYLIIGYPLAALGLAGWPESMALLHRWTEGRAKPQKPGGAVARPGANRTVGKLVTS